MGAYVFSFVDADAVTPLQKVVKMMDDMLTEAKNEKHEEAVEFAKKFQWCDDTRSSLQKSIAEGTKTIAQLEASIEKAEADSKQLGEEIAGLQSELAAAKGELDDARSIHEKETADYDAAHADLSSSVDALERAMQVLKSRANAIPQSFLEVKE